MITKEMSVREVITKYPQTIKVFKRHGLECTDCQIADLERVERGARVHHVDVEALLKDLNEAITPSVLVPKPR